MPWVQQTTWETLPYTHHVVGSYQGQDWHVTSFQHRHDAEAYVELLNAMLACLRRQRILAFEEFKDRQSGLREPYPGPQGLDTACYTHHLSPVFFDTKDALCKMDGHFSDMTEVQNGPMYPFRRIPDEYRYSTEWKEEDDSYP